MYPTPHDPTFGIFVSEQVQDLRQFGCDVDVVSIDGRDSAAEYLALRRLLVSKIRDWRPDVIHAHYGLTGAVAATVRGVPKMTTFHGSDCGYVRWQQAISYGTARMTFPVFVNHGDAQRLRCPAATVVPMGVDVHRFRPTDRLEARGRLGWPAKASIFLLPGSRRNWRKRPDLFDATVRQAAQSGRPVEGRALEGFSRDEVVDALNASDVVVFTSDWEGSPVTAREALACGIPVISVPVGDLPKALAGLPGCQIARRDAGALASAALAAVASGARPELRARALETSRDKIARRLIDVYARLAGT